MSVRLRVALPLSVAVLAAVLAAAFWYGSGGPDSADPTLALLPRASRRVRGYCDLRYLLYFAANAWMLLGLWLAVRARVGQRICHHPRMIGMRAGFRSAATWSLVSAGLWGWMLVPSLAYYVVERSYGFAVHGPALWSADRLRDLGLEVAWAPLVAVLYAVVARSPDRWWAWAGAITIPLGVLLTVAYPVIIDPLYNQYRPLEEGPLRTRLAGLAEKAGLDTPDILVADKSTRTTKLNAYVTGIGPTHRIVLWDTLLGNLSDDEIAAITAHELGHYAMRHIWLGVLLHSLGGIAILWLLHVLVAGVTRKQPNKLGIRTLSDPAGLPAVLLLLNVLLLVQTPVASVISRQMERAADAYGLELCGDGDATARVFAAFGRRDYADPDPPKLVVAWLYTHPPLRERVGTALRFAHARSEGSRDADDAPPR